MSPRPIESSVSQSVKLLPILEMVAMLDFQRCPCGSGQEDPKRRDHCAPLGCCRVICEMEMNNGHCMVLLKKLPGDEGREMSDAASTCVLVGEHARCIRPTRTH